MSEPLQRWSMVVEDEHGYGLSQLHRIRPIAGESGTWVRYADIEALEREHDAWRTRALAAEAALVTARSAAATSP